jgi:hypothetical protein
MTYEDVQLMIDGDPAMTARFRHILPEIQKINTLAILFRRRGRSAAPSISIFPSPC